eukprot:CAMPEP_0197181476 /NCGR_PEP_ID=MMETSP1423-20130617/5750_1 /TAXON_ID=476441 /ORGANISM="Pseudo-nitzschia heimii, Strain UNC1101" /LENGTH=253 /DNA_ID=CAMNT_0042631731 /DNA_START=41 /DNA_END=802 /DNA_ORIENTATION=+
MKVLSILMFLAYCAMGSVAELDESRLLQYDDDSRVVDVDNSEGTTSGPAFPNGTPVGYWVDETKGWVDGSVVGFKDGFYYVKWDDKPGRLEGYDSHFSGDRLRLDALSRGASRKNDDPPIAQIGYFQSWENGTPVRFKQTDGTFRVGTVVDFDDKSNEYKVQFSDGETDYYDDYDILPIVQSATARQRYIVRVSIVGAIAGIILIILLWICVRRCCCRRQTQAAKATPAPDHELGLDEEDIQEETNKDLPPVA